MDGCTYFLLQWQPGINPKNCRMHDLNPSTVGFSIDGCVGIMYASLESGRADQVLKTPCMTDDPQQKAAH